MSEQVDGAERTFTQLAHDFEVGYFWLDLALALQLRFCGDLPYGYLVNDSRKLLVRLDGRLMLRRYTFPSVLKLCLLCRIDRYVEPDVVLGLVRGVRSFVHDEMGHVGDCGLFALFVAR